MLKRRGYVDKIIRLSDTPRVIILTGYKRVGKSSLLQIVQDELAAGGVQKKNIVYLQFEGMTSEQIRDHHRLFDAISARATPGERLYVFLDEVHRVAGWEKCALRLIHETDAVIYAAGSSSEIISGNVLPVLEGSYEKIEILPLSFNEYLTFRDSVSEVEDSSRELARFLMLGGFPAVHNRVHSQHETYAYIRDAMHAALWTDFVALTQLRRVDQLERVIRFVFENIGRNFSAKHMSDSLRSENKEINIETVYTYLDNLEKIYMISRCRRFDLQADEPLKTQEKFYLADPAMRYAMLGFRPNTVASSLENIVYLELKRRGYEVYVGKLGRRDLDFVAIKNETSGEDRVYIQMGRELRGEEENSDLSRLVAVRDSYPKYILTTDAASVGNRSGIKTVLIADFLSGKV